MWAWVSRAGLVPGDRNAYPLPLWFQNGDGSQRPSAAKLHTLLCAMGVILQLTSADEPGALKVGTSLRVA